MLVRLWTGTVVANLAGGWIFTWFIIHGYPKLSETAIAAGTYYVQLGIGLRAFCPGRARGGGDHSDDVDAARLVLGGSPDRRRHWRGIPARRRAARPRHREQPLDVCGAPDQPCPVRVPADGPRPDGWAALGNLIGGIGLVVSAPAVAGTPQGPAGTGPSRSRGPDPGDDIREAAVDEVLSRNGGVRLLGEVVPRPNGLPGSSGPRPSPSGW